MDKLKNLKFSKAKSDNLTSEEAAVDNKNLKTKANNLKKVFQNFFQSKVSKLSVAGEEIAGLDMTREAIRVAQVSQDNEYETDKQWKGSLKKYQLNTDGTFGSVQWDAADKLNSKTSSTRNIWTPEIGSDLNNFTTANRDLLKSKIFPNIPPTDTEADNLINFIRGIDTYDQDEDSNTTESIHKLADIYHSLYVIIVAQ